MNGLGNFPVNGEQARKEEKFYKITPDTGMKMVSGTKTPVLLNFVVSNDVVHVGTVQIPAGGIGPRQTETDSHKGDAVFYVKEGPVTFFLPDTKEVYQVENKEFMFIPENVNYKIINYTGKTIEAVFIVGPNM